MKRILGLDLGTNSIGWAVLLAVESEENIFHLQGIEGAGSRIIPMDASMLGDFDRGNSISQTAERTRLRCFRCFLLRPDTPAYEIITRLIRGESAGLSRAVIQTQEFSACTDEQICSHGAVLYHFQLFQLENIPASACVEIHYHYMVPIREGQLTVTVFNLWNCAIGSGVDHLMVITRMVGSDDSVVLRHIEDTFQGLRQIKNRKFCRI